LHYLIAALIPIAPNAWIKPSKSTLFSIVDVAIALISIETPAQNVKDFGLKYFKSGPPIAKKKKSYF